MLFEYYSIIPYRISIIKRVYGKVYSLFILIFCFLSNYVYDSSRGVGAVGELNIIRWRSCRRVRTPASDSLYAESVRERSHSNHPPPPLPTHARITVLAPRRLGSAPSERAWKLSYLAQQSYDTIFYKPSSHLEIDSTYLLHLCRRFLVSNFCSKNVFPTDKLR